MNTTKGTATALTLAATAALGVGVLSACGSPSASESPSTTPSETASRDAGWFSKKVKLTVINETGDDIAMTQTSSERQSTPLNLKHSQDEYVVTQSTSYQVPNGGRRDYTLEIPGAVIKSSTGQNPDSFTFINLDFSKPYMRYENGPSTSNRSSHKEFSEDQTYTWKSPTSGHSYVIKRGDDTNTKVFTIFVK